MTEKKFKVVETAIDLSPIKDMPFGGDDATDYVVTNIGSNNDFLLNKHHIGSNRGREVKIITIVDFTESLNEILLYHLDEIGRSNIDILLLSASSDWDSFTPKKDLYNEVGVYMPSDVSQLENIKDKIGYVGLDISPLNYNYEVLQWCEKNEKKVIGFNPFGGFVSAPRNIKAFGVTYLLRFSAANSDIMVISSRNYREMCKDLDYIQSSLIGKDIEDDIYTMNKSMYRPVKEIKKAIYSSLIISDYLIDYNESDNLINSDIKLSIGKKKELLPKKCGSDLEKQLSLIHLPENISEGTKSSIIRYKAKEFLLTDHKPGDGWIIESYTINPRMILFNMSRPAIKHRFWQKADPPQNRTITIIVTDKVEDIVVIE